MYRILLIVCCIISFIPTQSQNSAARFREGRVWFKVKDITTSPNARKSAPSTEILRQGELPAAIRQLPVFTNKRSKSPVFRFDAPLIQALPNLHNIFTVEFDQSADADAIIAQLLASGMVEYAEKEPVYELLHTPDDPLINNQWALQKVRAQEAWSLIQDHDFLQNGSDIIIAIVDDAIDINHPDLSSVLWINHGEIPGNGIDDDGNGFVDDYYGVDVSRTTNSPAPPSNGYDHGTHVAGIAAAQTNNQLGVASLSYNVKLMAIKASDAEKSVGYGYQGIIYAINNGANIINCSWGSTTYSSVLQNIIDEATSRGIIIVAAAGNSNNDIPMYPAALNGVISVANTTDQDVKGTNSNFGTWVTVSAPGTNIYSTNINNGYTYKTGTSMAAPMVASLMGLLKAVNPSASITDIRNCAINTATDIESLNPSHSGLLGTGRIDAEAAVACILNTLEQPPIALFEADIVNIHRGASVYFKNQSSSNPETYSWSFPGGTPATFNGAQPPAITYSTTGSYTVSLTVTNEYGTDTYERVDYITVSEGIDCEIKNADNTWNNAVYTNGGGGYVNGTHFSRPAEEKAMFFNLNYSGATHITSTQVHFYSDNPTGNSNIVTLKVYDGTNNLPGALLHEETSVDLAKIMNDFNNSVLTTYEFDTAIALPASKKIFIAIDFSNICNSGNCTDRLSIVSSIHDETAPYIWEKYNGQWLQYGTAGTYNLSASLKIYPAITADPFNVRFSLPDAICAGTSFVFDGSLTKNNGSYQWVFDNKTDSLITHTLTPSGDYATAGTHTVSFTAQGGACNDLRTWTETFIVRDTPTLSYTFNPSVFCSDSISNIVLSGADQYFWEYPSIVTGYQLNDLSVVLPENTSFRVMAGKDGCNGIYHFDVPVTQSVSPVLNLISDQPYMIYGVPMKFNVSGDHLGDEPVFTFYRNSSVVQTGNADSLIVENPSPGDQYMAYVSVDGRCLSTNDVYSNSIMLSEMVLNIELNQFNVTTHASMNELQWSIHYSDPGDVFEIERSTDGTHFSTIWKIEITDTRIKNYQYKDLFQAPIAYYRLKMINNDGHFVYSNVVIAKKADNTDNVKVIPSMVQPQQGFKIASSSHVQQPLSIEIYSSVGQRVYQQSGISAGQTIRPSQLGKGIHYVRIYDSQRTLLAVEKIVVQ